MLLTGRVNFAAMIRSFGNEATRAVFEGRSAPGLPSAIQQRALAKLQMLHAATTLDDLAAIPGNGLELLSGEREGKHCIRINASGRICFRWEVGHAHDVEIFGYH
jgi:toxin HigB-1